MSWQKPRIHQSKGVKSLSWFLKPFQSLVWQTCSTSFLDLEWVCWKHVSADTILYKLFQLCSTPYDFVLNCQMFCAKQIQTRIMRITFWFELQSFYPPVCFRPYLSYYRSWDKGIKISYMHRSPQICLKAQKVVELLFYFQFSIYWFTVNLFSMLQKCYMYFRGEYVQPVSISVTAMNLVVKDFFGLTLINRSADKISMRFHWRVSIAVGGSRNKIPCFSIWSGDKRNLVTYFFCCTFRCNSWKLYYTIIYIFLTFRAESSCVFDL